MRRGRQRRTADIDITPLIDVLFMLIIFFVLTASFTQGRIEVALPSGGGAPLENEAVTITVAKSGKILWNGREVSRAEAAQLARGAKDGVMVAGDKDAPYGAVAEVLEILRKEGVDSAGLLMQGEDG